MKNLKFATKLLLVILSISLVSVIVISAISYTGLLNLSEYSQDANARLGLYASDSSRRALIEQAEAYMTRLAVSQAGECDAILAKIQSDVTLMAAFMSKLYENPGSFRGRRLPLPYEVPADIATAKMMVAPGVIITPQIEREMLLISNAEHLFSIIHAGNANLVNAYLGSVTGINFRWSISNHFNPNFDPRVRPWYLAAYDAAGAIWLEAHVDAYGEILTTCAAAYTDAHGRIAGVAASDIELTTMVKNIHNMRIGETGYAFLIDNKGHYLAHPHFDELDLDAFEAASAGYREVIRILRQDEPVSAKASVTGRNITSHTHRLPLPAGLWALLSNTMKLYPASY